METALKQQEFLQLTCEEFTVSIKKLALKARMLLASARAVGPGKSSSHKANADIDTASGVGDARVSVIDRGRF